MGAEEFSEPFIYKMFEELGGEGRRGMGRRVRECRDWWQAENQWAVIPVPTPVKITAMSLTNAVVQQFLDVHGMAAISRNYETRLKTKNEGRKSKVDWKRTKRNSISQIFDSDDECSTSEDDLEGNEEGGSTSTSEESDEEPQQKVTVAAEEDECIILSRRKRKPAVMDSSDESRSDSDGPVRKVAAKRRCIIDEDDEPIDDQKKMVSNKESEIIEIGGTSEEEAAKTNFKKRKNLENLKQLAEKRRSKSRSISRESFEDDDEKDSYSLLTLDETSEMEDSDSLEDFIVKDKEEDPDEDDNDGKQLALHQDLFSKHHIPLLSATDQSTHLQRVVKAFLINITSPGFLSTLYEGIRKKKYAKEMLNSLTYLDKRIIQPRLENLTSRSRWSKRYKERVESYPNLRVVRVHAEDQSCQACQLHRYCKYNVILSGTAYDSETLEEDEFMPNDRQNLKVGMVCANRTIVYHQLKHFKYHLYQRCIPAIDKTSEKSAKEMVEICFSKLEEKGVIKKEVDFLRYYLDEADYFHEEKVD
ncbi:coiled-coil domain-containing protein 82 [Rhinophrynus dorsalis]